MLAHGRCYCHYVCLLADVIALCLADVIAICLFLADVIAKVADVIATVQFLAGVIALVVRC